MDEKMKEAYRKAIEAEANKVDQTNLPPDSRQPPLASFVVDNNTYPDVMEKGKKAMEQGREQTEKDKSPDR